MGRKGNPCYQALCHLHPARFPPPISETITLTPLKKLLNTALIISNYNIIYMYIFYAGRVGVIQQTHVHCVTNGTGKSSSVHSVEHAHAATPQCGRAPPFPAVRRRNVSLIQ